MKTFFAPILLFLPVLLYTQTIDSTYIREVDSLIELSRNYILKNELDRSLEVSLAAEQLALERIGRNTAVYGKSCFNLGRAFYAKSDYPKAEKWYLLSKTILEETIGKENNDYAWCLNNLGVLYRNNFGQNDKAEQFYLEAKSIREKIFGKEHREYAASVNNLGIFYKDLGQYDKAEPFYHETIEIVEKVLGKEHRFYPGSLNNLANLYWTAHQYEKAESMFLKAKDVRENVFGKEDQDYAWSLNSLANFYWYRAQYHKVEPLFQEAGAIYAKALGNEHPKYLGNQVNLGGFYLAMGHYQKAEPIYLEIKDIREKTVGKKHPDYAASLEGLSVIYRRVGNLQKALSLQLEAMSILENMGKDHSRYIKGLVNLGIVYKALGEYEKAEQQYLQAKAVFETRLDSPDNHTYLDCLANLGSLYLTIGEYQKAEPLFLDIRRIREETRGKEDANYARALTDLAILYNQLGQFDKAVSLEYESVSILEKALGKEHPQYASNIGRLGTYYRSMGEYEKAEPLFIEQSTINQKLLGRALQHLSEQELDIYIKRFNQSQYQALSFAQQTNSEKVVSSCYNDHLFYNGFLLNAATQVKRLAQSNPVSARKFNELKSYHSQLATQYSLPLAERDLAQISQLETQANDLEKELTRTVAGYGKTMRQVKWQEVQTSLHSGEAAIEFVHYDYLAQKKTDSTMYAALLVLPGWQRPKFVPLFEEKQLDLLLSDGEASNMTDRLYASRSITPKTKSKKISKDLYSLIWKPLEKELEGINTVYFSLSGQLNRLNIGAIPVNSGNILADKYNLVGLRSTRQLVLPEQIDLKNNDAILFGGIEYKPDSTKLIFETSDAESDDLLVARGHANELQANINSRGGTWNYLPGTEKEVITIEKIMLSNGLNTKNRLGYMATEEVFKGMNTPSPRIVHVATHGFFFADPGKTAESADLENDQVFRDAQNPLIRSGLIMAGANHAWQTGKPLKPGMEDGILTAYEISQMDLSNTELVVLSACETGLGDIQGNEGVYGLQRAFKIAGAKYLIMSLWQVPDQQTQELMTLFYSKWLKENLEIPQAFRAAQQEMRNKHKNPYLWAGFVLME